MQHAPLPHEAKPAHAPARSAPRECPRILVMDEDRDLRWLYADVLARRGYRIDIAGDGAVGWEALQTNHYHLLITEHDLPSLTGLEVVRKLRSARMAVPVVMAAVRLPRDELDRDPSLKLSAVLTKPFYISQFLEMVRAVLLDTGSLQEEPGPLPPPQRQPSKAVY
jgi:DNA-binding response OmpR family regulator